MVHRWGADLIIHLMTIDSSISAAIYVPAGAATTTGNKDLLRRIPNCRCLLLSQYLEAYIFFERIEIAVIVQ